MEILVIRHGETYDNTKNICQGQTEGELNGTGMNQALKAKEELENTHIDVVYTSDLRRAVQTCDIIFNERPEIVIKQERRLRERYLGKYQGHVFAGDFNYNRNIIDGAESVDEMFVRVRSLLDEVKLNYPDKKIAFISHGITIKVIIAALNNMEGIEGLETPLNCSITKFDV